MLKGVLTACARLPACVRARWTMSALTASTRLKSSTKGWISLGKRPSIGVTPPARCDASCARNRASGRSPPAPAPRPPPSAAASAPSAISSMWLKRPTGSASAAVSAATASRSAPDSDSSGERARQRREPVPLRTGDVVGAIDRPSGKASVWSHSDRERAAPGITVRPWSSRRSICQYSPDSGCPSRGRSAASRSARRRARH